MYNISHTHPHTAGIYRLTELMSIHGRLTIHHEIMNYVQGTTALQ